MDASDRPAGQAGTAVVVTGAHRSGTTVLGDLICRAASTWTVWEPFNQHWGLRDAPGPYAYLDSASTSPALTSLEHYLRTGRGAWSVKRGPGGSRLPMVNERVRAVRRRRLWRQHRGQVAVVKDPFLLLALAGVQSRITTHPVIVSIRHPCSWLLSLRRVDWPVGPELNALIRQDELYETHLRDILPARDWTTADDVEAGATAWACLYHLVRVQQARGVNALVVPLETFGREPVATMTTVYEALGLDPPHDLVSIAEAYTGSDNAVKPAESSRVHLLNRDSRALSHAWRTALSPAEMALTREITEPVYGGFYSSWDSPEG